MREDVPTVERTEYKEYMESATEARKETLLDDARAK